MIVPSAEFPAQVNPADCCPIGPSSSGKHGLTGSPIPRKPVMADETTSRDPVPPLAEGAQRRRRL